jgi:hypothetical protein
MPLGGYCDTCQRWVWLTPYGDCVNGHPASVVHDVQQLKEMDRHEAGEELAVRDAGGRARFRFWWRHSLWIAWTFTAGFFNWLGFVYVGVRARHAAWVLEGFAYLTPLLLTIASWGTPLFRGFVILQLVTSAASVAHALYVRPLYRAIMFGDAPRRALPAPPQPPSLTAAIERPALPRGLDEAAAGQLGAAHAQVENILRAADGIGKREVRDKVVRLCRTADEILDELGQKPRKLSAARSFLTYYLDAAARIVQGYASLCARASGTEVNRALRRAEDSLDSVQQAFDRQLAAVLEDRVFDLEAEIELLERTVAMESLSLPPADDGAARP